jgi:hypothetical protein
LTRKGLTVSEIAYAVGISERLAQEYLDLYQRYDVPEYQDRLEEMVQMVSDSAQKSTTGPKRGA